jgi:hypothetical protein
MRILKKTKDILDLKEDQPLGPLWILADTHGLFEAGTCTSISVIFYRFSSGFSGPHLFINTTADCPAAIPLATVEEGVAAAIVLAEVLSKVYDARFVKIPEGQFESHDVDHFCPHYWMRVDGCALVMAGIQCRFDGEHRLRLDIEGVYGESLFFHADVGETRALEQALDLIETSDGGIFRIPPLPAEPNFYSLFADTRDHCRQSFVCYPNFYGICIPNPPPPPLDANVVSSILDKHGEISHPQAISGPSSAIVRIYHRGGHLDKSFVSWSSAADYVRGFIASLPKVLVGGDLLVNDTNMPFAVKHSFVSGFAVVSDNLIRITYITGGSDLLTTRAIDGSDDDINKISAGLLAQFQRRVGQ